MPGSDRDRDWREPLVAGVDDEAAAADEADQREAARAVDGGLPVAKGPLEQVQATTPAAAPGSNS